ncbi:hypothetical protein E1258_10360 [Micromonospora sp. KC207]|uniref:hypothetical protein n=1 Tax=Micromonospora sp. KC207 TaxID=2530377 RepID=UPI001053AE2C|nr:hypothetical protein [Micromonospora sp. KC207]TDC63516.1 hypothetical protein E1258_10360 [Micromonospora sp. KC207]
MSDERPVFVIHGIANRDPAAVAGRVAELSAAALDRWPMHSVYWGDLGSSTLGVDLAIPPGPGQTWDVRDGAAPPAGRDAALGLAGPVPLTPAQRLELVRARARQTLDPSPIESRGAAPEVTEEALAAIAEAWPRTRWLRHADDPTLLGEVGAALAAAALDTARDAGHEVRDPGAIRLAIRRRLPELDRVAGAAVGAAGERFYTWARIARAQYVALTLGDVLVYQRHGERIRARIREQIAAVAGERAGRKQPVHLIGHSLGAVIALDLATGEDPVRTAGLVTFGCQWPLFHLFDPRGGQLAPYDGSGPVLLPDSLGRWANLWHPLDPLGFVASRLFRWADGSAPRDVRVEHLLSDQLYTHSAYWTNPRLVSVLHETFAEPVDR